MLAADTGWVTVSNVDELVLKTAPLYGAELVHADPFQFASVVFQFEVAGEALQRTSAAWADGCRAANAPAIATPIRQARARR
jgi:hypothetical protein